MSGPRIDALGVAVSDMALAIAFYSRLGLEFPPGSETEPHAEATLGDSMRLMLDTEAMLRQIDPDWTASPGGRLGLAVRLSDPASVDRFYSELADDGLGIKPPWDAFWGQRYAVVSDPEVCTSICMRNYRTRRLHRDESAAPVRELVGLRSGCRPHS